MNKLSVGGSTDSLRLLKPNRPSLLSSSRSFSPSVLESTRYTALSPRQSYSSEGYHMSEPDYDARSRAFSYNGRNSGPLTLSPDSRLSGDWKMPVVNRNSDPIVTSLSQLPPEYRPYRNPDAFDSLYVFDRPRISFSCYVILESSSSTTGVSTRSPPPSLRPDVPVLFSLTITFFALHYTHNTSSFLAAFSEVSTICDYVVHTGKGSAIVAVAYLATMNCDEMAICLAEHEHVPDNQITIFNSVSYSTFFRIRDYVL